MVGLRSVEGQDGARNLTRLHRAEGLIEVVQTAAAGDHLVEQQAALAIEVEGVGRSIARRRPAGSRA